MNDQLLFSFFNSQREYKPSAESNPIFWIRQMRFVKKLSVEEKYEIRTMHLKKGLNILWSKSDEPESELLGLDASAAGHAAGKTTFCRFIRYILGESTYGNRQVRNGIQQRFPEGYVLAEIFIENKLWSVALPFSARHRKIAQSNATIDELLQQTAALEPFEHYLSELQKALAPKEISYPTGKKLLPSHALTWLTRDQEARYNNITSWRVPASDSQSPDLNQQEKTWLVRHILELTCPEEDDFVREEVELQKQKQERDKLLQEQEVVFENDKKRLKELHQKAGLNFEHGLFETPTIEDISREIDDKKSQLLEAQGGEKNNLFLELLHLEKCCQLAHYTQESWLALNESKKELQSITRRINLCKNKLEEIRKNLQQNFCHLKEIIAMLVRNFLGNHFSAEVSLKNRHIHIAIKHRGERKSVAIETVKVLIFDLAAMILSTEGRGHHPRFLMHDSPREADINSSVYQALFLSVIELQDAYGERDPAFQYIITTTAAPPQSLLEKHLIKPILDASIPEGRLLKSDL